MSTPLRYRVAILAVVLSMVAGCGARPIAPAVPQLPSPAPSMTSVPSPAATEAAALSPALLTPTPGEMWTYSVLGDSSSWGFPKYFARDMEADLGVKVDLKSYAVGGATSADVLEALRENEEERLDVSRSKVVTFYGNPLHIIGMRITSGYAKDRYDCSTAAVARFKAEMASIADEILQLRKGQPTIIRTYTRFMPFYRTWKATGNFEEFSRCAAALDEAVIQMAAERHILVADTALAMNGPNRDQDPNDKDLLADGIHENAEGAQIVAEVFRGLGYEMIVP